MVAPAGTLSEPASLLRAMVAASATFQTAVGASSATLALPHVLLRDALPGDRRPYCTINPGQKHGYSLVAGGAQNQLRPHGSLFLFLTIDTPPEHYLDRTQADYYAANFFGQVIDNVMAVAGADNSLSITGSELLGWDETPEDDWNSLGRFYYAYYHIEWGDGDQ